MTLHDLWRQVLPSAKMFLLKILRLTLFSCARLLTFNGKCTPFFFEEVCRWWYDHGHLKSKLAFYDGMPNRGREGEEASPIFYCLLVWKRSISFGGSIRAEKCPRLIWNEINASWKRQRPKNVFLKTWKASQTFFSRNKKPISHHCTDMFTIGIGPTVSFTSLLYVL